MSKFLEKKSAKHKNKMNQSHVSVLELNLNALKHNISYFKRKLKPNTKLLAVVKAFSYGHDAVEISKCLSKNKVDYLAVAYANEGIILRKSGIKAPILVLHPQVPNFEELLNYDLEPAIYSKYTLESFLKVVKSKKVRSYPIHLEFNTGLNRLGLVAKDIDSVLKIVKKNSFVKITSVFSHLAASEDLLKKDFTINQIEKFKKIASKILKQTDNKPILHLSNTSGIINYPEAHFDMVRVGIGMYGFGNDAEETSKLKNVGTLKSIISQINEIEKGESVGYNRAFMASKKTKIATIPIGHADGISRKLGNEIGYITLQNTKCPIVGNVCMDMIMVDITNIQCKEGDEVIIFHNQKTVNDLASKSDTISYEIIAGISHRIPRKIISDC